MLLSASHYDCWFELITWLPFHSWVTRHCRIDDCPWPCPPVLLFSALHWSPATLTFSPPKGHAFYRLRDLLAQGSFLFPFRSLTNFIPVERLSPTSNTQYSLFLFLVSLFVIEDSIFVHLFLFSSLMGKFHEAEIIAVLLTSILSTLGDVLDTQ